MPAKHHYRPMLFLRQRRMACKEPKVLVLCPVNHDWAGILDLYLINIKRYMTIFPLMIFQQNLFATILQLIIHILGKSGGTMRRVMVGIALVL